MREVEDGMLEVSIWWTVKTLITDLMNLLAASMPSGQSRFRPTCRTIMVRRESRTWI